MIAKMKGTFTPREKQPKTEEHTSKKKKKKYVVSFGDVYLWHTYF